MGWARAVMAAAMMTWCAALGAPAWQIVYDHPPVTNRFPGYWLLLLGWLGPLGLSVAWYANLLFASAALPWLRGRPPRLRRSATALALATTALLPCCTIQSEADMTWHWAVFGGTAVWLWLAAFALAVLAARLGRPRPQLTVTTAG